MNTCQPIRPAVMSQQNRKPNDNDSPQCLLHLPYQNRMVFQKGDVGNTVFPTKWASYKLEAVGA